ncbi:phosphoribosyltransferase [Methanocella sp. CWC-04]|uniref:Phosphoribosyltransferase n=1 Tax=Methanooceanicella nereidis TaxID=2052831 RepID=A0AAP2RB41_9EURY|nr:phosphoribosyltransferase family protein [Methanocella sp. CWC-04]MCD1294259.1 phosphoribosyltransferase [Methanocella sp. CWC-04]
MRFKNRSQAGKMLAKELSAYKGENVIVLAIPMGGVPVGYEVAREYRAPLDLVMSKKIGAPFNPELAIGAVTWNGAVMVDQELVDRWQVPRDYIRGESNKILAEMNSMLDELRVGQGNFPKLYGRIVFIVDDGIATGSTMMAAVEAIRDMGPKDVVIATPVLPSELVDTLRYVAPTVYVHAADDFEAVGQYYEEFETLSNERVKEYLLLANQA